MQTSNEVKNHELTTVDISTIQFDETNPNKLTQKQMDGLRQSMLKYGYLTPVIIDQNGVVADGEHRALVYKQLGYDRIPVYRVNLETDADRKILRQVMNKLHGEHDKQLDSNELLQIFNENKLTNLATLIAQQQSDLEHAITRYHPEVSFFHEGNFDLAKELEEIVPTVQLGELYQLDRHRLICADSTDGRSLTKLLETESDLKITVNQLNTDPPYGVRYGDKNAELNSYDGGNRLEEQYDNDELDYDYHDMFKTIFTNLEQYWADYNTFYIWSGGLHLHEIREAMKDSPNIQWGDYLVWIKNKFSFVKKDYQAQSEFCIYGWYKRHRFYPESARTTVLNYNKPTSNDLHPAMKPIALIKQTIEDGTQPNDNILDLFTGSGTTLIAAEQTNRNFYGIELDPHYCDVIIKRWEQYTGKKAIKL